MELFTYAILNTDGVCIDRIVVDENFIPEEYTNALLDDLNVEYSIVKELPGEEYFLDVEAAPHINPVVGIDANTDVLSQLTEDQKKQLVALLTSNSSENTTS